MGRKEDGVPGAGFGLESSFSCPLTFCFELLGTRNPKFKPGLPDGYRGIFFKAGVLNVLFTALWVITKILRNGVYAPPWEHLLQAEVEVGLVARLCSQSWYLQLPVNEGIGLIMIVILCLILKCFILECVSVKMNK